MGKEIKKCTKCSKCLKIIPQSEEIKGRSGCFYCEECWKGKWEYRYYEGDNKDNSRLTWPWIVAPILLAVVVLIAVWWIFSSRKE